MTWEVNLNGNIYNQASVAGNSYADEATGLPAILRDTVAHVRDIFRGNSATSNSIGPGSKSFSVTPINRPFTVGGAIRAADVTNPTVNYMDGTITAYNATTGALTIEVPAEGTAGSGTFTNWLISVTAGQQGPAGPQGAQGIAGSGSGPTWQFVSTTVAAAVAGYGYLADTSGGAFTITLPASPVVGTQIAFADAAGTFATNNLTVARNGNTINGTAADLICDVNRASFALVWSGSTWRIV